MLIIPVSIVGRAACAVTWRKKMKNCKNINRNQQTSEEESSQKSKKLKGILTIILAVIRIGMWIYRGLKFLVADGE